MLRLLCWLCLFSSLAMAQDPAARCVEALLRGDAEAAAAAVGAEESPARRARLQAALVPLTRRPAAMLAVATRFVESPEADAAILAGAASVLALRDDGAAVPALMAWIAEEDNFELYTDEPYLGDLALGPIVEGLWHALGLRVARGGDATTLAEGMRLLDLCRVSRFGFVPARVRPSASWELPERSEDLLLRAWRREPGRGGWRELDCLPEPTLERLVPRAATGPWSGLGAGDWLVELASTTTPWRGMRAVEVSDLDVVALVDRGVLALGAWRGGQPVAGGEFRLRQGAGEVEHAFVGGANVAWAAAEGERGSLLVRSDGASAWIDMPETDDDSLFLDRWQAHLMLDRPLYRPGETIQGRVVLRRCRFDGEGLDAVARPEVAADQPLTLRAFANRADELCCSGRTDTHGVFAFALPLPVDAELGGASFEIDVPGDPKPVTVAWEYHACRIANFRRPALLLDVNGPAEGKLDGEDPEVVLHAAWASGAPAAGMAVTATATTWGREGGAMRESFDLSTDRDGCATLIVALAHLGSDDRVGILFTVETPDGLREELGHSLRVRGGDALPKSEDGEGRPASRLRVRGPEDAVVGVPCRVTGGGPAGAWVLRVVGRGRGARAELLQLDERGEARTEVTPTRAEWPALDLVVATADARHRDRVPVQVRSAPAARIDAPTAMGPGEEVTCTIATGVAGTVVTVAVVDERIFAIAPDRTEEPNAQLRPSMPQPDWRHAASAPAIPPSQLLGAMLEDGRVPAPDYRGDLRPGSGGGPSTPGPGGGGSGGDVRNDFRATAAFVTVVAGEDGAAVVPFTLPDDLTTWRISVVGIAPDGIGFQERRTLATRLPLAATPLLPRVLREGDAVAMAVAIDRAAAATADSNAVHLTAGSEGPALAVEGGDVHLAVAAGEARATEILLRGVVGGEAALSLSATLGPHADRSRRAVTVQRDVVARSVSAAAMGDGRVEVPAPDGSDPENGLDVVVLGGSSAAWRAIERQLTKYPYGCVEQTLSRLLPFFAAVRGARAHGTPPPVADEEFRRRLDAGLRRLRRLQESRGGGFAFWPDGDVDAGMTALVLHGLAVVREGGVDPARSGLRCDPEGAPFVGACRRLAQRGGLVATTDDVRDAELAAACLRSVPGADAARRAVAAVVDAGSALPPGLWARTGLAMLACGDRARAERCRQQLTSMAQSTALAPDGFPGEDPLAVRALQLELHCELYPDSAEGGTLAAEVLLQCLQGYRSTYAQACALSALALALPPGAAEPFAVQVVAGDVERRVELTPAHGFTARRHLPFSARCAVVGPAGRQLLLRVVGERTARASDHAAWQAPLVVERELCRERVPASKDEVDDDDEPELVPIGDAAPRVGEGLWVRISVRSPVPLRYVVVECPLPAGFGLPEEPWWMERFDDRVAFTFDRIDGEPVRRAFAVVPTMAGTVGWPPAVAAPMYVGDCEGGSAGRVLRVAPAGARPSEVASATCFGERPPVAPPEPPAVWQLAYEATDALRAAWDATELAAARDEIAARFDTLEALVASADREDVLEPLTSLWEDLRDEEEEAPPVDPALAGVRATLVTRCRLLQRQLVLAVLDDLEGEDPKDTDSTRVATLLSALSAWGRAEEREPLLGRMLRFVSERPSEWEDILFAMEDKATTPDLRAELLRGLGEQDAGLRPYLIEVLPLADLAALPPTVLVEALGREWPDGIVELLLATASGREELRRCLRRLSSLRGPLDQLVTALPDELWAEVPLAAYAEWVAEVDMEDLTADDDCELTRRLADSPLPSAALQQELVATRDAQWRLGLACALRRRGVRTLDAAATRDDPTLVWWTRALAIGADEAGAASQLIVDIEAWRDADEVHGDPGIDKLYGFVLPILVAHGTAAQLVPVASWLDEEQCRAVFARLEDTPRRELVNGVTYELYCLPAPADLADCEALWDYGVRCEDPWGAVEALCRDEVGVAFVRARVTTDGAAADDRWLRMAFADLMGLDADTLEAPVDEPWRPVLHTVVRRGLRHPWSEAEQQQLEHLRRLRGVW